MTAPDKPQYIICHNGDMLLYFPLFGFGLNELQAAFKIIHISDRRATPADQFKRMASATSKQIKCIQFFKIYSILEYIEQAFPGKVSSRPGRP
jgi:hypothetical protein